MADTKLSALSELSVPALEDLLYLVDDPSGTPASQKISATRMLALAGFDPGGRLTLTTGVPVTTSDVTGAGTLYYTPYKHNLIRIYDGTRWRLYTFTERSLALTLTSGKNYDVFIYDNSGTLTLELSAAWTNDTTRADALTTQDGVAVKNGATTRLWLGTIRASGTDTTEDSYGGAHQAGGKRYVWNAYNRVRRGLGVKDTTDSWTYNTNTFRASNNSANNKVEFVVGAVVDSVLATVMINAVNNSSLTPSCGIGVDSTSTNSGRVYAASVNGLGFSLYFGYPGLGYHALTQLEIGAAGGNTTFFGDVAVTYLQGGMVAEVMA